jgi:hypothetical protein
MISGEFDWLRRRARIRLDLLGAGRRRLTGIPMLVDTAFSGQLALTASQIAYLGLERAGPLLEFRLAHGQIGRFAPYRATVLWDGEPREVIAVQAGDHAMVGLGLLLEHSVWIEVIRGGRVIIQKI